jgi:hypothetical protein
MIHENNKNQHFCTTDVAACAYKIGCSRSSFEQFNFVTPVNFVRKQMAVLLYLTGHYSTPSPNPDKGHGKAVRQTAFIATSKNPAELVDGRKPGSCYPTPDT